MREDTYTPFETYTSVRATPELVGREEPIQSINAAITDREGDFIVYISGTGGIGKTYLVRHVLEHPPEDGRLRVARELLDLYHADVHTIEGFAWRLSQILPAEEGDFEAFRQEYETLNQFSVKGPPSGFDMHEQRLRVGRAFIEDLNRLAEQERVVFALDTAEKLLPLADPTAEPLGLATEYPDIWKWLLESFLPNLKNVVVLLASRPSPPSLEPALEGVDGKDLLSIPLTGFNVEETKAYFDAVAEAAREHGDDETAERIEVLDADIREGVYQALCHCDETADERGVRPILLSLVIDHLVTSGRPSEALRESIQQPNAEHAAQTRRRIEAGLVEALMNVPRSAIETIRTLAVLRKGADASLLARAAGLQASDGMWEETKARDRLDEIRSFSFVKIRPRDQRVFLHDEMYDLLRRHVMDKPGGESQKWRVLRDADDYYDEAIEEARNRLAKLVPDPGEAFPKLEVLSDLRVKLEDLLTEALHYALRRDPQKGVDTYIRLAAGTLAANDESLDMRLRAELFGTLGQERTYAVHEREWASDDFTRGRWNERLEDLDKLLAEVVIPDAAVRWVKRLTQRRQYAAALEVAARLRSDAVDLIRPGGGLALADLAAWEGALRAYQGDYEEAEKAMREAQREVEGAASLGDVRWRAVMGRIYNNLGYIARTSGQVLRAAELYKDALPYWRDLKLEILQANTLNNLAYALALQGGFGDARRQAKDALDLRKRLGPQPPVVLSLTTLAEIEILAGRYQDAEAYAEHARQLAENLDYERGKGFALLALAALRRFLADPQETSSTEERRQLLVGALQASQQALDIFRELGEWEGRFRGFYEKAIALREQCRLAHEDGDSHWSQTQLEQKARTADSAFERAAKESREHGRWDLYFDAQMGRAWLNQYLEAEDAEAYLDTVLNDIRELVPEYLIKPTRWPGIADTTIIGVFAQLARYHILQGILALDRAEEAVTDEKANYLSEAGVQFTLAFEYDRHIAEDFRDLNRGIEVVYDRLRGFNTGELLAVFDGANLAWGRRMPRRGGPGHIQRAEDLLFWRTLEEHFGTYEKLRDLARAEG